MYIPIRKRITGNRHMPMLAPIHRAYFKSAVVALGIVKLKPFTSRLYEVNGGYLLKWWNK